MKLTRNDISSAALQILHFCDAHEVKSTADLQKLVGTPWSCDPLTHIITLTYRPSEHATQALTLSYLWPGVGIPIEARINPAFRYSRIILKAGELFDEYRAFDLDSFCNIVQMLTLPSSEYADVKHELEELARQEV